MITTEQREIDLVRRFSDGTPLSGNDMAKGRDAGIFGTHGQNNGWTLSEYGRSLLNGTVAALDSCVIGPGTCNPTPPEASALDVQVAGDHYKEMKIQPVQFIEANNIRFLEGCIIKRACRHGSKSGAGAKDLRKIIHEAQLLLELRYGEKP